MLNISNNLVFESQISAFLSKLCDKIDHNLVYKLKIGEYFGFLGQKVNFKSKFLV